LLALTGVWGQEQSPTEVSYIRARQAVERGLDAMGGQKAIRAIEDISFKSSSRLTEPGQSINPAGPFYVRPVETEGVIDLKGRRSSVQTKTVFVGGGEFRISTVLLDRSGFTADLGGNAIYPLAAPALAANQRLVQRTFPHLLLQVALRRAATLRSSGSQTIQGRACDVVTFADVDGTVSTLYFDGQTGLLTEADVLLDRLIEGLGVVANTFSEYRDVDGIKIPFQIVSTFRGEPQTDLVYKDVKFNTHPPASLFAPPSRAVTGPEVGGPPPPVTLTRIGKDAYLVNAFDTGGVFFYSSIVVVFNDYVLVVEAPLNDSATQAIVAKIKETAPGKPVKYLVQTHDHVDHLGGIRGYIAEGAVIVSTPATAKVVKAVAAVNHPLNPDRLQQSPRPVLIESFIDKRIFDDGDHRVELYNVGPTLHSTEIVIAFLPHEKTVFLSDLVPVTFKGEASPKSPVFVEFYSKLRNMGLDVQTTISGHGRIAPIEELRRLVEKE